MQMVLPLRRKRADDAPTLAAVPAEPQPLSHGDATARNADASAEEVTSDAAVAVRIEQVELGSLASVALRTALVVTTIGALAVLLLWTLADAGGFVRRFESFMRSIGFRDFQVASGDVLLGLVLIVAGLALALAALAVMAGAAYNLLAATGSGLRVRIGPAPSPVDAPVADVEASRDDAHLDRMAALHPQPVPDPAA